MNVLIIGSGGREHALAWKIAQSPRLKHLYVAPGNPGTAKLGSNVAINPKEVERLVQFARNRAIDLVVVGPENALEAGLSDALAAVGIPCFGPRRAAARIESSKAFSKQFMAQYGIPTPRFIVCDDPAQARQHLESIDYPVVIKASGLAAGKGVILPGTLEEALQAVDELMIHRVYGAAGEQVIIEERLEGEEVSLLAFCDGHTVVPMPPAQDHKRLLEGDQGPNTGGMGAYAPAPVAGPELVEQVVRTVFQPALAGLNTEGLSYVGVLYAGLILTGRGPSVLEFNARFGDPETQAILPLLENDLLEVCQACVEGRLNEIEVRWKPQSAACVVLTASGYPHAPQSGQPIHGADRSLTGGAVFHAGTRQEGGKLLTAGGRVLGVTCWDDTLSGALDAAYQAVEGIQFDGMFYRKDIGRRALQPQASAYAGAGVNIDAGNRAVALMSAAVRSTYTPHVLAGIGSFGGLFDAAALCALRQPVLVASTDGVGTKVKLAAQLERFEGIGEDIVNHCIDDILVQGARPLFFLDYFASARLDPERVAQVVSGMARACSAAGIPLLGGETAEMPGVYQPDEFDVAGTIVGRVEREHILPRPDLQTGDVLIGFRSSGPHTNGYSLIRKIFAGEDFNQPVPALGGTLADALLAPHRSYLNLLIDLIEAPDAPVKALAHLTGGGFIENIPRILPRHLSALIQRDRWPVPPLYGLIQLRGRVPEEEMYRVFNMGIGMIAVVAPHQVERVQQAVGEQSWVVGELVAGEGEVVLV